MINLSIKLEYKKGKDPTKSQLEGGGRRKISAKRTSTKIVYKIRFSSSLHVTNIE